MLKLNLLPENDGLSDGEHLVKEGFRLTHLRMPRGGTLSIAYQTFKDSGYTEVAFCFCSPKDQFSKKVAHRILRERLGGFKPPFRLFTYLPPVKSGQPNVPWLWRKDAILRTIALQIQRFRLDKSYPQFILDACMDILVGGAAAICDRSWFSDD